MKAVLKQMLPPVILLAIFTFILYAAWTGSIKKVDDMLEPFCTKTLPSLVPQRLQEPGTMLNPSNWYVRYDWDKIQTGTFPRR